MIFVQHSWSVVGWLMLACGKNDKTVDDGQKCLFVSVWRFTLSLVLILTFDNKNKYAYIKYKGVFLYLNNKFLQYGSVFS